MYSVKYNNTATVARSWYTRVVSRVVQGVPKYAVQVECVREIGGDFPKMDRESFENGKINLFEISETPLHSRRIVPKGNSSSWVSNRIFWYTPVRVSRPRHIEETFFSDARTSGSHRKQRLEHAGNDAAHPARINTQTM